MHGQFHGEHAIRQSVKVVIITNILLQHCYISVLAAVALQGSCLALFARVNRFLDARLSTLDVLDIRNSLKSSFRLCWKVKHSPTISGVIRAQRHLTPWHSVPKTRPGDHAKLTRAGSVESGLGNVGQRLRRLVVVGPTPLKNVPTLFGAAGEENIQPPYREERPSALCPLLPQ